MKTIVKTNKDLEMLKYLLKANRPNWTIQHYVGNVYSICTNDLQGETGTMTMYIGTSKDLLKTINEIVKGGA